MTCNPYKVLTHVPVLSTDNVVILGPLVLAPHVTNYAHILPPCTHCTALYVYKFYSQNFVL